MAEQRRIRVFIPSPMPTSRTATLSGVDKYIFELVQAMGDRVEYVFSEEGSGKEKAEEERGPDDQAAQPASVGVLRSLLRMLPTAALILGYGREILRLRRSFREYRDRADIVHVNQCGCEIDTIAAKLAGFRHVVMTVHAMHGEDSHASHWFRRFVERLCFRCSDMNIVVSDSTYEAWQNHIGLSRKRVRRIFNGMRPADLTGFDRQAYRKQFTDNPQTVLIGICARLRPMKGHLYLLEAFAKLMNSETKNRKPGTVNPACNTPVMLLIAGDGTERALLERRARELGVSGQVQFLGHRTDNLEFVASLDVHVLPSIYIETIGFANIEAMLAGVPCVVSDTGGMKEIVGASCGGRIVPARDSEALYEALKYYVENPDARRRDGESGRAYALENLTAKKMADQTLKVYEEMAASRLR